MQGRDERKSERDRTQADKQLQYKRWAHTQRADVRGWRRTDGDSGQHFESNPIFRIYSKNNIAAKQ